MHAHVERDLEIGLHLLQHGKTAGDMESADDHRHACRAELTRDIEGTAKLGRLDAHKPDHPEPVMRRRRARSFLILHARVELVDHRDVDVNVRSEHLPAARYRAPGCRQRQENSKEDIRASTG